MHLFVREQKAVPGAAVRPASGPNGHPHRCAYAEPGGHGRDESP